MLDDRVLKHVLDAIEIVESACGRTGVAHVPLAHHPGRVAVVAQDFSEGGAPYA